MATLFLQNWTFIKKLCDRRFRLDHLDASSETGLSAQSAAEYCLTGPVRHTKKECPRQTGTGKDGNPQNFWYKPKYNELSGAISRVSEKKALKRYNNHLSTLKLALNPQKM
jgi:hypothetical protein